MTEKNLWRAQANNMLADLASQVTDLQKVAKDCSDDLDGLELFIGTFSLTETQRKLTALRTFLNAVYDRAIEGEVIYQSIFDDTEDWGESNLNLFDNVDAVSDGTTTFNNCLGMSADDTDAEHGVSLEFVSESEDIEKKKISLKYYIPDDNTNVNGLRVKFGEYDPSVDTEDARVTQDLTEIGVWTEVVLETTTENLFSIVQLVGTDDTFVGEDSVADDLAYITDVRIVYLTR